MDKRLDEIVAAIADQFIILPDEISAEEIAEFVAFIESMQDDFTDYPSDSNVTLAELLVHVELLDQAATHRKEIA